MDVNARSNLFSGIGDKKVKLFAYAFCGFCAGIAGLIGTSNISTSDATQLGLNLELDAILAVVIGGTLLTCGIGNVIGTLFGVLINGTIVSILQFNGTLSSWWTRIGVGLLTLIFIGIQILFYMKKKH